LSAQLDANTQGITDADVAPDGSLWGAEGNAGQLVHVLLNGKTFFVPTPTTKGYPWNVRVASDGSLFFSESQPGPTEAGSGTLPIIGHRLRNGRVVEQNLPSNVHVTDLAVGTTGVVAFADGGDRLVGTMSTAGFISVAHVKEDGARPDSVNVDESNHTWFIVGEEKQPGLLGLLRSDGVVETFPLSIDYVRDLSGVNGRGYTIEGLRDHKMLVCGLRLQTHTTSWCSALPSSKGGIDSVSTGSSALVVLGDLDKSIIEIAPRLAAPIYTSKIPIGEPYVGALGRVWFALRDTHHLVTATLCGAGHVRSDS
jgi:hypothetical protein